ncbi:hypothetical protein HPB52_003205 [Rhipicephalus sanguineus]|uniref:Uncharacterized protein n=1 Tax=Rhipicephalus sanguineus TaxID=34632 RepID=A0A9D4SRU5_RHISA|nr:hypothetical protein HPB52_003205 [Rhipicephalus sanguineus]
MSVGFMVHSPHRAGGLSVLELSRGSEEVQVKSFERLQRLGSPIVDAVLQGTLDGFRRELKEKKGVSSGIVEATLRPVIVVDFKEKQTFIPDVVVAWDARTETLEAMCAHKRDKYASLLPVIRQRRSSCEVKVLGLAFGGRGPISPSTKQAAKEIGLWEGELAWLAARTLVGSLIGLNRFSKRVLA